MKKNHPNVLFILSDQHRFCDVGYMGNQDVETPVMDMLAENGAYFTSSYSTCPLCVPARGNLLTGQHALKHGAAANDLKVREDAPSIARAFRNEGYQTAYIGKWHLGGVPREQFIPAERRLGFEFWNGYNCNHQYYQGYYDDNENVRHKIDGYEPVGMTDRALDYLKHTADPKKPWLMFVCYGPPHDPYFQLPEGELAHFQQKHLKIRENVPEDELQEVTPAYAHVQIGDIPKMYAGYYGHIHQLDVQIGRLYDYLKETQQLEDTVVIYTSDHGDMLGSHGWLNKQLYFEESAKVPLIISWEGHIKAGERKSPISSIDLAPTLLGLIQGEQPDAMDGTDQSAVLRNPDQQGQDYVYFYSYVPCHQACFRELQSWRAVADGRYVYVVDEFGTEIALYDLLTDPFQMHDCKEEAAMQEQKSRLRSVLDGCVQQHDGYIPWDALLEKYGLLDEWDQSQAHFEQLWHEKLRSRHDF